MKCFYVVSDGVWQHPATHTKDNVKSLFKLAHPDKTYFPTERLLFKKVHFGKHEEKEGPYLIYFPKYQDWQNSKKHRLKRGICFMDITKSNERRAKQALKARNIFLAKFAGGSLLVAAGGLGGLGLWFYPRGGKTEGKKEEKTVTIRVNDLLISKEKGKGIDDLYFLTDKNIAYESMVESLKKAAADQGHDLVTTENGNPKYVLHVGTENYCDKNIPNGGLVAEVFNKSGPVSKFEFMFKWLKIIDEKDTIHQETLGSVTIFELHEVTEPLKDNKLLIQKEMIDQNKAVPVLCINLSNNDPHALDD